jgi:hypothetical protein
MAAIKNHQNDGEKWGKWVLNPEMIPMFRFV